MDEEFALCWNNFQDNIQTGFQNLYDRGDLVDVTLAMDGKLLHAHKIVLAICSPYFQEMFNTNPCKHPIIILKDVSFSVMCELLQFMYQGVVNVKHTELSSFMKIAQMLQIKGLATAPSTSSGSQIQKSPDDLTSNSLAINTNNSGHNGNNNNNISKASSITGGSRTNMNSENSPSNNNNTETKISSSDQQQQQQQNRIPISENSSSSISSAAAGPSLKRLNEFSSESLSVYSRKLTKRTLSELSDNNEHLNQNNDSMDNMNPDDVFLPPIPHISIGESPRFDLNNVKREFLAAGGGSINSGGAAEHHHHSHHLSSPSSSSGVHHPTSPGSVRNSLPPPFNFEYNMYAAAAAAANKLDYSNDLHLTSDFTKGGSGTANHMDIPPGMLSGSQITMLSSTSLLHGNCIFNRNNTVATQQGMKTYWLCKSYRISMCRARCITHQGRVISATGVHNHLAHMKGGGGGLNENYQPSHPPPPPPLPPSGIINPTISITNITSANQSSLHHSGVTTAASSNIVQQQHSVSGQQSQPQQHLNNQMGSPGGQSNSNLAILSQHQHHSQQPPQQQQQSTSLQQQQQQQQQHQQQQQLHPPLQLQPQHHHHHQQQPHSPTSTNNSVAIQNMMQNVLTQNSNLMHISHMSSPMLNVSHHHQHHHMQHQLQSPSSPTTHQHQSSTILNNIQISQQHQIAPVLSPNIVVSPSSSLANRTNNRTHNHQIDSPNLQEQQKQLESPLNNSNHNSNDNASLQHHPDLSHSSTINVSNNPISSPLCDENVTVTASSSHDSSNNSSSHIMASISISPDHHQQFKIEDM